MPRVDVIDGDRFGKAIEQIFDDLTVGTRQVLAEAVQKGVRRGAAAWRYAAKRKWGDDPSTGRPYYRDGEWHRTGKYTRSVRSHMVVKDGDKPYGEVGTPNMPGLPHLLELGHARIGGGRVPGFEHIAPAADVAFGATKRAAEELVEKMLHEI